MWEEAVGHGANLPDLIGKRTGGEFGVKRFRFISDDEDEDTVQAADIPVQLPDNLASVQWLELHTIQFALPSYLIRLIRTMPRLTRLWFTTADIAEDLDAYRCFHREVLLGSNLSKPVCTTQRGP